MRTQVMPAAALAVATLFVANAALAQARPDNLSSSSR